MCYLVLIWIKISREKFLEKKNPFDVHWTLHFIFCFSIYVSSTSVEVATGTLFKIYPEVHKSIFKGTATVYHSTKHKFILLNLIAVSMFSGVGYVVLRTASYLYSPKLRAAS
jgi:hypothetical protein